MEMFSGKKALCFIALPHHNRFLVPIMEALRERGMEALYFTSAAEGAFEITLNQAHLPYRHVLDYASAETRSKVSEAYRELRSAYQEKILANHVLQSVPIVIQDKVIRSAVENYYCLDRMIRMEKPDLLFALHELNPWGKMLGYLSHAHRIPYFTLQEGLYYSDIHYYRFHTDYSTGCLVWGEDCRQILLRAGCSDDKIYSVGNTHLWAAKAAATADETVRETRAALGLAPNKKIILFLMSHSHYQPFDARVFVDWMKRRGDVVAVFKWHPVTSKEIVDRAVERISKDAPCIHAPSFDTYRLIGASDICITVGNSTTGLEALAFGKPLLEVRLPDQGYSFAERGVAEPAMGFEDIGEKCEAILSQGVPQERLVRVEQYLAHNFAFQDHHTMERIIDLLKQSLQARARATGAPLAIGAKREIAYRCSLLLPVDDADPQALLATLLGISAHTPPELFEIIIVNCSGRQDTREVLARLNGDVTVIEGQPDWNYAACCNRAAAQARGKFLVFLKPGLVPDEGWLEGLLEAGEAQDQVGVVGGVTLNPNRLIWHMGAAFDVNQTPFSIYRLLPPEFSGASKQRHFRAIQFPFLVMRQLFCRLGGLNMELSNRFDDIDFCLRVDKAGFRVVFTPACTISQLVPTWQSTAEQDVHNRVRFYSIWTGFIWQDDERYLREDGLTHDALSSLYRELAGRVAAGAAQTAAFTATDAA